MSQEFVISLPTFSGRCSWIVVIFFSLMDSLKKKTTISYLRISDVQSRETTSKTSDTNSSDKRCTETMVNLI